MKNRLKDFAGDEFLAKCEIFADTLLNYNKTHNISGAKSKEKVFDNIFDAVFPVKFLETDKIKKAIDVGTGAGFPGLLLAMYLPEIEFTLFEPILKKTAFLYLVKSKLELKNVTISNSRVEKSSFFEVDLITSRAVSSTKLLIDLTKNFIKKDTVMLLYKGSSIEQELEELREIKNYDIINNKKRKYLIIKDL